MPRRESVSWVANHIRGDARFTVMKLIYWQYKILSFIWQAIRRYFIVSEVMRVLTLKHVKGQGRFIPRIRIMKEYCCIPAQLLWWKLLEKKFLVQYSAMDSQTDTRIGSERETKSWCGDAWNQNTPNRNTPIHKEAPCTRPLLKLLYRRDLKCGCIF